MSQGSAVGPRPGTGETVGGGGPLPGGLLLREAICAAASERDVAKIYSLQMRGMGIATIDQLHQAKKLRQLDLSGNKLERIHGLEVLADLRELKLFSNRLREIAGLD
eukprot:SAG31_NODE_16360_length_712_cov_0.820555_1_plen_106_part_10